MLPSSSFPIANADLIVGMARGMAVLESFDTQRQRLNATLAAQRAGITRAAARRHLLTLAHLGYLESDGSYFWLSPRVLRLAGSYLASARLPRAMQPMLDRLAGNTGQACSVVVLDGAEVVIVARSETPRVAPSAAVVGLHLGARLPAHATSTGHVLLAGLEPDRLRAWLAHYPLMRLTPHTITQAAALRRALATIRTQDWCLLHEAHELGVHALAVPLRTMQGQMVAALNVVVSTARAPATGQLQQLLPLLQAAAREVRGQI